MWPPAVGNCNYSYSHDQPINQYDHYHHQHYPQTSANVFDCYQSFTCPSDLPVEANYYQHVSPPLAQTITSEEPTYWCPIEDDCSHTRCKDHWANIPAEQSRIFNEISKECEHFLNEKDCDKCRVRHKDGEEETIPIEDLVEIVMKTVDNLKKEYKPCDDLIDKKREQNKVAAARYRDKQKARWNTLMADKKKEEERKERLTVKVKQLKTQVEHLRAKLLEHASKNL